MTSRDSNKCDSVNGLLLLDKPAGLTSNAALSRAKRQLLASKGGHTGSLDPIATGLLLLCFGKTTRIAGMLLECDKTYRTVFRLGESTETGDSEGRVIARTPIDFGVQDIERTLEGFRGRIQQVPPMYSAIKKDGKPLYRLARQNLDVERAPRDVTVHRLEILDFKDGLLSLSLACSKGFYVRSLAMDLGRILGCGGHVQALRRESIGRFRVKDAIILDELAEMDTPEQRQEKLIPTDRALDHLPRFEIPDEIVSPFCQGQAVPSAGSGWDGLGRIYSSEGNFLGLGEWDGSGKICPRKVFAPNPSSAQAVGKR